ncbi:MAG TPA: ketoisovalerate oxidoreductase [Syntrophaceticus sp.]|jgi:2-oxoglutarate ferredoxin oxidoreductase subunit gamma|uniref:Pyruvate/ketoisovalerate oxidoreductase, gamma subunit n=1 Tax=Syntrophaceticus schinkii TaxID=499207 RepID=A0A0B7MID2_9FIRM|nr:2-oxoacid:acceptor oxidoreductase family protein [Syntrophaceticus schinkii]HHY30916.1 ketoisovalerate oxidoreductase [Syntrophaceticus sp.]MDD2359442.1 2-oxoacid:acceptor oxidoreductase family protein [Syntrophaceticus schinkii]MDD4261056.1 2-oxoacid:acceptor oxidoreductase family protein [Syntrophaceticus schinkii]MDD4674580.1 2-oxoacid:acceptor oxidoreductase family protein [Syntrophaceticus schinkii]CEO90399.1 Pyruvate/ketoisovalerate oxidoreductase, gamma subunit [Syntrophaceticus schi
MGKAWKIALAGEGGQGVQSVAMILTEAAALEGKEILYIPNFGVEQRGGVSIAFVQIGDEKIGAPKFKTGDIVIALSDRAVRRVGVHTGPETLFIYDAGIEGIEKELPDNAKKILAIPALKTASEELHPRVFNILIMGAVIGATNVVKLEKAREAIEKKLGYKFQDNPELRDLNFRAVEKGISLVKEMGLN